MGNEIYQPLTRGARIIPVQQIQYYGCWCPGFLRRQDISTYGFNYEELLSSSLTWGKVSTTCVTSV